MQGGAYQHSNQFKSEVISAFICPGLSVFCFLRVSWETPALPIRLQLRIGAMTSVCVRVCLPGDQLSRFGCNGCRGLHTEQLCSENPGIARGKLDNTLGKRLMSSRNIGESLNQLGGISCECSDLWLIWSESSLAEIHQNFSEMTHGVYIPKYLFIGLKNPGLRQNTVSKVCEVFWN